MSVSQVPIQPIKKGSLTKLWLAIAVLAAIDYRRPLSLSRHPGEDPVFAGATETQRTPSRSARLRSSLRARRIAAARSRARFSDGFS